MLKEQLDLFITDEHTKLIDAMQKIDINANGILFVVNEKGVLCGTVSDGDIRRYILKSGSLATEVSIFMNRNPISIHRGEVNKPYQYMKNRFITALPVIDVNGRIEDILLVKQNKTFQDGRKGYLDGVFVVVMAGGKGTRLYPYTKILPKPLIPVDGIPIVERIINNFCSYGVSDFMLTVNCKKNMIRSYFADVEKNYKIEYVEEDKPLGTAGSLNIINRNFDRPFFITNCDILIRADYYDIYRYHKESGNKITIVAAMKDEVIPYGVINSKGNGEVESMQEKPHRSYFVNTGMYVIDPGMAELVPQNTFFHMTHLVDKAISMGHKVGMYPVSEDSFLDMGEFEELRRMEEKLKITD